MQLPVRVAHLTSVHSASDGRIAQKECATLAAAGYDVVVVAPGASRQLPPNVRHHAVPMPRNRLERFTKTIWQVFRAAIDERADVYHFHDPELIPVGIALRAMGSRVIFDVHEDVPLDIKTKPWIPVFLRPGVSTVASWVLRAAQRWFTAIVPATPSIAQSFTHPLTIVVRNYPRLGELTTPQIETPFSSRPLTAIYMGSITPLRGIEEMVRAMAEPEMPADARLVLAGEFEDETLRSQVQRLPGWSRVQALGQLQRQALAKAMADTRMGLLLLLPAPNHDHAMPTKFFEYMEAGLPVIASKFLMAYRGIVDEHDCGVLVDPRDPAEIAAAMCRLFVAPSTAQAMGRRGRAALLGRYEWNTEANSLIRLYREIA